MIHQNIQKRPNLSNNFQDITKIFNGLNDFKILKNFQIFKKIPMQFWKLTKILRTYRNLKIYKYYQNLKTFIQTLQKIPILK